MREDEPAWHCAPVPSWGEGRARFLIAGLAPGRAGANRTGVPFTGDDSGTFLFDGLQRFGFATPAEHPRWPWHLNGVRITNVVRCLPPKNRPTPEEVRNCRPYLRGELERLFGAGRRRVAVLALGRVAHEAVLDTLGLGRSAHRFAHGAAFAVGAKGLLVDSFHPSRYNTNTGRLTVPMFAAVLERVRHHLNDI